MKVIKRDGTQVEFDPMKISTAIKKAQLESNENIPVLELVDIADDVIQWCNGQNDPIGVEEIQDVVESTIMKHGYYNTARCYIKYRAERTRIRNQKSKFMKVIGEKLTASNVQNQNANVDEYSFGGRRGEAASELMKQYALDNCMSEMARNNHLNNEVYIHDLDSYVVGMHNCLTIPFDDLLANGFNTRQTDVRPANSINTAFQLVAVIFQLQSLQQFGGVAASHLDWTMIPYVRKSFRKHYLDGANWLADICVHNDIPDDTAIDDEDFYVINCETYEYAMDMTKRELKQAVEGMYHNLNTLQSRSGNQLPFTSINYGTCTLPEGRMVTKALLEGSLNGVGKLHKTPIFPCGIFQMMNGVNRKKGDPNYDLYRLALQSTAKRLYPNYANCDWSGNAGYDKNDPKTYFATINVSVA